MAIRKQRQRLAFEAVANALGAYFIVLLLAGLILDSGMTFRWCLAAAGVHLATSVWILVRRINRMTRADYLLVSCGLMAFSATPSFRLINDRQKQDQSTSAWP